ncbi:hypothetical protein [Kibdelosporangium philippinense]|uniref:hypothetical protein n=1 Tax=Kibdelosporangium philippinense TaxID=211113 RepID=UPI00361455E4
MSMPGSSFVEPPWGLCGWVAGRPLACRWHALLSVTTVGAPGLDEVRVADGWQDHPVSGVAEAA